MFKDIKIKKIKTSVPYDIPVTSMASLPDSGKATLEAYFTSKNIYEVNDKKYVLLDIMDNSAEMKAMMFIDDSNTIADDIKFGLKYRIAGIVSIVGGEDDELPFLDDVKGSKVFFIGALQCYSDTFLGVDIDEFNINFELQEQYDLVTKYSDYLKDIDFSQIKDMKVSCYDEFVCLLVDGTLFVNGVKQLDNIDMTYYINNHMIVAVSADNIITCLTKKGVAGYDFINNDNYRYKKILATEFGIIALTDDGIVKYFGDLTSSVVDYSRFVGVDDIELDEVDDIVVIKDGKTYSLFHVND